jgi:hypothetical protein
MSEWRERVEHVEPGDVVVVHLPDLGEDIAPVMDELRERFPENLVLAFAGAGDLDTGAVERAAKVLDPAAWGEWPDGLGAYKGEAQQVALEKARAVLQAAAGGEL